MSSYKILYWKEIPTQIKYTDSEGSDSSYPLSLFFQQAIDAVAMHDGSIMHMHDPRPGWVKTIQDGSAIGMGQGPSRMFKIHRGFTDFVKKCNFLIKNLGPTRSNKSKLGLQKKSE